LRALDYRRRSLRRNAQLISRWVLLALTPPIAALTVYLCLLQAPWSMPRVLLCSLMLLVSSCLILSIVNQRHFWWAPRLIAGIVCLVFLGFVVTTAFEPERISQDPQVPALFAATLAFLLWGLPALCFLLWGHTGGKLARDDAGPTTRMDLWTGRLLLALRYAMLIAVGFYFLRLIYLEILAAA
jgi:hypothetical protein